MLPYARMWQQSKRLKSQSATFIPWMRGSIRVAHTPRATHPCVIAADRLSRPFCTRPPSNNLGGLFSLCIRDVLMITAYYVLILSRCQQSNGAHAKDLRGDPACLPTHSPPILPSYIGQYTSYSTSMYVMYRYIGLHAYSIHAHSK
jgi:hypothetical protein